MTIQLVETSEEDSFVLVAQHVANVLNDGQAKTALAETPGSRFLDDCTILLQEQRFDEFLARNTQHLDQVLSKATDKDAECICNVLVHAVARVTEDKIPACAKALAVALTGKLDERSEERLSAVLNLYGVTNIPAAQYAVLLVASEFARRHPRLAAVMIPAVKGKSDDWVRQWGLNDAQARDLYINLAGLFKVASDKASVKEYQKLLTSALMLVKEGDAQALAQLRPHAVAAVADFIRNPAVYQFDVADAPAVKQLANDAQFGALYKLLTVMLSGDISGFKDAATPAVLELAQTNVDVALNKMRMIAMLTLASRSAHEEVSFSSIQKALDIPAEQVESWIVRAIGQKLLEGKIDQVRNMVVITRCTHRTFTKSDWGVLRSQLTAWRDNLVTVQQTMAQQKAGPAPARINQAIKV